MTIAPVIMYAVAAVAALTALIVVTRRPASEGGVYAKRIGGTMLAALAVILALFASALASWGPGR